VPTSPKFVRPCIPAARKSVPAGAGWLHEPKLDGYRLQVVKEGRLVRLFSKGGYDWTKRLARLAEALTGIPCQSAVIDAELIFPAANGVPDFAGLQKGFGGSRQDELAAFAFDLIHRDGTDLTGLPLAERRRRLERLLGQSAVSCLHLVRCFDDGAALFIAAEHHGLEGIVSKRQASPYSSGPSRDWVKIKTAAWRAANRERWRLFEKR
jgi:bifunctional non-homologous end joining protein LigD